MTRATRLGRVISLAGVLALAIGFLAPAGAEPAQIAGGGNQGTVKIDGYDADETPANEPHVGCTFGVDFYIYEGGIEAEMVFDTQPPGTEPLLVVTGTLPEADDAGWNQHFDIDLTEALVGHTPDPAQGHHVRLTIHAYDGEGNEADTKHKVFWVGPCEETTTTTAPEETTTTTTAPEETTTTAPEETTTTAPEETTTTAPEETTTTAPEETTTTAPEETTTAPEATTTTEAGVLPTDVTQTTPPTEVEGVQEALPRTGFSMAMLALGWVLLGGGLAIELVAWAQRRRDPA